MQSTVRLYSALLAVAAVAVPSCRPGGTELAEHEGVAAEYMRGEGPGARIDVVESPRETEQAAPAGEAAVELRRFAEPDVTVYDPPPDLSRWDLGVVYVPPAPSAAPASGDTVGTTSTLSTRRPSMSTTSNRSPNASNESPAAGIRPR